MALAALHEAAEAMLVTEFQCEFQNQCATKRGANNNTSGSSRLHSCQTRHTSTKRYDFGSLDTKDYD